MKVKVLIILFFLIITAGANAQEWQEARMNVTTVAGAVSAAASCQASPFFTNTTGTHGTSIYVGSSADTTYGGMNDYAADANYTLCKIHINLTNGYGSITGVNFKAGVFTLSSGNLNTQTGDWSENVAGNNAWSNTEVEFTWLLVNYPSLSSGTTYAVVITTSDVSGDNPVKFDVDDGSTGVHYVQWKGDKTANQSGPNKPYIKLYAYQ